MSSCRHLGCCSAYWVGYAMATLAAARIVGNLGFPQLTTPIVEDAERFERAERGDESGS